MKKLIAPALAIGLLFSPGCTTQIREPRVSRTEEINNRLEDHLKVRIFTLESIGELSSEQKSELRNAVELYVNTYATEKEKALYQQRYSHLSN